jgi:MoxR-like ATPase
MRKAANASSKTATPRVASVPEREREPEQTGFRGASAGVDQHGIATRVLHNLDSAKGGISSSNLTLTVDEARDICDHMTKAIVANPAQLKMIPPVMLWGPPGVGKSSIMASIADRHGIGFVDMRLAEMDPQDVGGLRIPDARADGDRLRRFIPDDYPREGDCPHGILMLDELSSADKANQVAAYRLTFDRNLGRAYSLPDGYAIFAAGNTKSDRAVSTTMSSALANRFAHLEIQGDPQALINYFQGRGQQVAREHEATPREERRALFLQSASAFKMETNEIHPDVIGFLRFNNAAAHDLSKGNPERGWPSGRSWERASTVVKLADLKAFNERQTDLLVQGLVGAGVATEFSAFRKLSAGLPNAYKLLTEDGAAKEFTPPTKNNELFALSSNLIFNMFRTQDNPDLDRKMVGNLVTVVKKIKEESFGRLIIEEVWRKGESLKRNQNGISPQQQLLLDPKANIMPLLSSIFSANVKDPRLAAGKAPTAP